MGTAGLGQGRRSGEDRGLGGQAGWSHDPTVSHSSALLPLLTQGRLPALGGEAGAPASPPSVSHPFPPSCLPSSPPWLWRSLARLAAMDRYSMEELIQLGQGRVGLAAGLRSCGGRALRGARGWGPGGQRSGYRHEPAPSEPPRAARGVWRAGEAAPWPGSLRAVGGCPLPPRGWRPAPGSGLLLL